MEATKCKGRIRVDGGFRPRYKDCPNKAGASGYCGVHDPDRKKAAPKCQHVDEETGSPDCSTIVRGSKYCSWHADAIQRHRRYAQAAAQRETLSWLVGQHGAVDADEVRKRLEVFFRNEL